MPSKQRYSRTQLVAIRDEMVTSSRLDASKLAKGPETLDTMAASTSSQGSGALATSAGSHMRQSQSDRDLLFGGGMRSLGGSTHSLSHDPQLSPVTTSPHKTAKPTTQQQQQRFVYKRGTEGHVSNPMKLSDIEGLLQDELVDREDLMVAVWGAEGPGEFVSFTEAASLTDHTTEKTATTANPKKWRGGVQPVGGDTTSTGGGSSWRESTSSAGSSRRTSGNAAQGSSARYSGKSGLGTSPPVGPMKHSISREAMMGDAHLEGGGGGAPVCVDGLDIGFSLTPSAPSAKPQPATKPPSDHAVTPIKGPPAPIACIDGPEDVSFTPPQPTTPSPAKRAEIPRSVLESPQASVLPVTGAHVTTDERPTPPEEAHVPRAAPVHKGWGKTAGAPPQVDLETVLRETAVPVPAQQPTWGRGAPMKTSWNVTTPSAQQSQAPVEPAVTPPIEEGRRASGGSGRGGGNANGGGGGTGTRRQQGNGGPRVNKNAKNVAQQFFH